MNLLIFLTLLDLLIIIISEFSTHYGVVATLKILSKKRLNKKEREQKVLYSLVELFIHDNQPIGSKTLMEKSFKDLSSATIRNYFAALENSGYLSQQHASGGRIPTELAYKVYADEFIKAGILDEDKDKKLKALSQYKGKEVGAYLQQSAELVSSVTNLPTFISSPRFDQDSVIDIKLVLIDSFRCLCVVLTELGLIHSEVLYFEIKLHHHSLKRIEEVLLTRLKGMESATRLSSDEEILAYKIYNEVMVRYIIGYANFSMEEIYSTGLSRLLTCPEFNNAERFASGLALFENPNYLREIVRASCKDKSLRTFIGSELSKYSPLTQECAVIVLPYYIGGKIVGSIGVLGPMRIPYRSLFGTLRVCVEYISTTLTKNMIKHKLTYRTPQEGNLFLESNNNSSCNLLEDKRH